MKHTYAKPHLQSLSNVAESAYFRYEYLIYICNKMLLQNKVNIERRVHA